MNIQEKLDERDIKTIAECLTASVYGDFFPEWEFDSIFGVKRDVVHLALDTWPDIDLSNQEISDAIVGSLNNLLGYPHRKEQDWLKYISVEPDEVKRVLDKLLELGL